MKQSRPIIIQCLRFFILILCLVVKCNTVFAEQTVINIPSSEVLPFENIILKDSNRITPNDSSGVVTPSVVFGLGHGFELSTGVATAISDTTIVRGNFAAKKVFFLGKATRLSVGGSIGPYFNGAASPDSFIYSHLTQKIRKTRTSLTAGMYAHGSKNMPHNAGVLLGVEQVLVPNKLRLAADWISGDNSYGKMGLGLKYRPVPSVSITSAVIIPNKDEECIGFNISISKFISLKDYTLNKEEDVKCQEKKNL